MGILPSKPDPSRTLEVIGAGFSRTGTLSTALAFEKLFNGPAFHGGSTFLLGQDRDLRKWCELFRAKRDGDKKRVMELLRELTAGYVGCTDAPPIMFIPELLEIYPNAKVVLNDRNPERWWHSMREQMDYAEAPWVRYLTFLLPALRWFAPTYDLYVAQAGAACGYPGEIPIRWGPSFLEAWNKYVTDIVPAERLLVFELKDGWEPLCKFLGKPVPDEPFPFANDSKTAQELVQRVFQRTMLVWVGLLGAVGAIGAGVYVSCRG